MGSIPINAGSRTRDTPGRAEILLRDETMRSSRPLRLNNSLKLRMREMANAKARTGGETISCNLTRRMDDGAICIHSPMTRLVKTRQTYSGKMRFNRSSVTNVKSIFSRAGSENSA
jgi:hypothetical protein